MINPQEAIEFYKKNWPYQSAGMDDESIYRTFKSLYPQYEYPDNPFKKEPEIPNKEQVLDELEPGFAEKLLTANLADRWASEHDWAARAYNNSISGTLYTILHGEPKYDVDMESSGWLEDVGGFFLGLASPVDIGLFAGSGGVGGFVGKSFLKKYGGRVGAKIVRDRYATATSYMAGKEGLKKLSNSSAKKLLAKKGAIESGVSLATYGAAGGLLSNAAEQRTQINDPNHERESFDLWENTYAGVKHGFSSGILGAAGGYVTKGLMLPKFAKAKAASDKTFANAARKLGYGPLGQVGAEAQIFTGGQLVEMALSGHEVDLDTYWATLFTNTGIIGGLKTGSKLIARGRSDVHEYNKFKKAIYDDVVLRDKYIGTDTKGKTLDNLKESLADAKRDGNKKLSSTLKDEIIKLEKVIAEEADAAKIFKEEMDIYNKLVDKLNTKTPSELTPEEKRLLIQGQAFLTNMQWSMYKEMLENPDAAYQMQAKKLYNTTPDKLTTDQKKQILKNIEQRMSDLEGVNTLLNETSILKPDGEMQNKFAESFEINIVPGSKKNKYNVEIIGPDNKKAPVFNMLENLTKKQAENVKKGLKEQIQTTVTTPPTTTSTDGKVLRWKVTKDAAGKYGYEIDPLTNAPKEYWFDPVDAKNLSVMEYAEPPKNLSNPINASNPNISTNQQTNIILNQLSALQALITKGKPTDKVSIDIPMTKGELSKRVKVVEKILEARDKSVLTKEEALVWDLLNNKRKGIYSEKRLDNMSEFDKIAFIEFALQQLSDKTIKKATAIEKHILPISKFLVQLNKDGKSISSMSQVDMHKFFVDNIPGFKEGNTRGNTASNAMSLFLQTLHTTDFVTGKFSKSLIDYSKSVVSEYNDWTASGGGKSPAREGIRQNVIALALAKGDRGLEIATQLGGRYYIRYDELMNLSKKLKKDGINAFNEYFKQEGTDWYLDMKKDIAKYKTSPRKIWIDTPLVESIKDFTLSGKSFSSSLGKAGKMIIDNNLTNNTANVRSAFYDLRRRGKSVKRGALTIDDLNIERYLFGNESTRLDRVYIDKPLSERIADQKRFHNEIKSPIEVNKKFLIMPEGKAASKDVHLKRREIFRKLYEDVGIKILDEFDAKGLPLGTVGYIQDGIIRIKNGKAPAWAIPHEITHHAFDMLYALRDVAKKKGLTGELNTKAFKQSLKLLEQAEKIFIKDGKFNEEYAVSTIDKVVNKMIDRPIVSKVRGWLKRFNRFLKSIFFIKPSKQEVAWALGEKILSRKGIPVIGGSTSAMKFLKMKDFASPKDYVNSIKRDLKLVSEKYNIDKDGLRTIAATAALIEDPHMFRISLSENPSHEAVARLEAFQSSLSKLNVEKIAKEKDKLEYLKLYRDVENKRIYKKNITPERQKEILEAMGIEGGDIWRASVEELKRYNEYLDSLDNVKRNGGDWATDIEIAKLQSEESAGIAKRMGNEVMRFGGPVHQAIEALGLKTLADKLRTHNASMEGHLGEWIVFEHNARLAVGDKAFEGTLRKRGIRDHLWALDHKGEMLLEDLTWMNKVSKKEKKRIQDGEKFFRKAISDEWWNTINKKGTSGKNLRKYLRKDIDGNLTPEALVVDAHIKMMDAYANKLESIVGTKLSEAETKEWIAKNNVEMIKDGIYMTRALTKEGKNALGVNKGEVEKIVADIQSEIANKEAIKKYGENYTTEQLYKTDKNDMSIMDYAKGQAWIEYHNMTSFSSAKFGSKHLKKRHMKQSNYMIDEQSGKAIRMYERDYTNLTKSYVYGISRFYANLQVFPELVSLDGFVYAGIKEQRAKLTSLQGQSAATGQWVLDILDKTVGLGRYEAPYEISLKTMEAGTRTLAKLGLSFPTSGLKNLLTGGTQTMYAYDVADVFRGLADYIGKDSAKMERAMRTGAPETGMRIWEGTRGEQMLDRLTFRWGFMKPTEKFNRYINVLISSHDQRKIIERIRTYPKDHKLHKKGLVRLREFYQLNEADIKLLKKYGNVDGVKASKFSTEFEKAQVVEQMKLVEQKMNTAAHINTQGSSADIFMPSWAGARGIRPLTLYKRMAYAATANTIRSVKTSIKEGNIFRPLVGLAATYASGRAMIGTYYYLLGAEMPHENSAWWTRLKTILWKGEFLGLLSEFFTPYDHSVGDTIQPAMYNTVLSAYQAITEVASGKSFVRGKGGALDTFMKQNIQIYNNSRKVYENNKENLQYYLRSEAFDKMWTEFEKENHDKKMTGMGGKNTRSPYYHDLRMAFERGTSEQFAKQYFVTVFGIAQDYVRNRMYPDVNSAIAAAQQYTNTEIKKMNPNKGSFFKNKKNFISEKAWMNFFLNHKMGKERGKELLQEVLMLEAQYNTRFNSYMKQIPYHARKFNVVELFKAHDWEIPKPIR